MFIQAFLLIMSTLHHKHHFNQISTIMIWILTNSHQSGHQDLLFSSKGQFAFFFFFALQPFRFRLINSVKGLFCLLQLLLKKKKKGKLMAWQLAGEFLIWRHPFARTQGCEMRVCMQNRSTWPGMPSGTSHSEFGNTQMHLWSVGKEMNDNHQSVFDHFLHEPCSSTWGKLEQHVALSRTDALDEP